MEQQYVHVLLGRQKCRRSYVRQEDAKLKLSKNKRLRIADYDRPVTEEKTKEKVESFAHTGDTYCLFYEAFESRMVFRVLFQNSYKVYDSYYDDGYKYKDGKSSPTSVEGGN